MMIKQDSNECTLIVCFIRYVGPSLCEDYFYVVVFILGCWLVEEGVTPAPINNTTRNKWLYKTWEIFLLGTSKLLKICFKHLKIICVVVNKIKF